MRRIPLHRTTIIGRRIRLQKPPPSSRRQRRTVIQQLHRRRRETRHILHRITRTRALPIDQHQPVGRTQNVPRPTIGVHQRHRAHHVGRHTRRPRRHHARLQPTVTSIGHHRIGMRQRLRPRPVQPPRTTRHPRMMHTAQHLGHIGHTPGPPRTLEKPIHQLRTHTLARRPITHHLGSQPVRKQMPHRRSLLRRQIRIQRVRQTRVFRIVLLNHPTVGRPHLPHLVAVTPRQTNTITQHRRHPPSVRRALSTPAATHAP